MRADDPRLENWFRLMWEPFEGLRCPWLRQRIAVFPQPAHVYDREWSCAHTERVAGACACPGCGQPYDEHPPHPDWIEVPTLHVTCEGWLAKT